MSGSLEGSPFEGVANPFGAPLFYKESTGSTMQDARDVARLFAEAGQPVPNGSVAIAGKQSAGRGRLQGRVWEAPFGENLLCTVILCKPPATALALRAGLAAARTFDSFLLAAGKDGTQVKWPNDVLYKGKKLSGILCESNGELSFVGAGLNVMQKGFPSRLEGKASSLALILGDEGGNAESGRIGLKAVLGRFLFYLKEAVAPSFPWRQELSKRLFMLNEKVAFLPGAGQEGGGEAASVEGVLRGVAEDGALLIETASGVKTFYSGELSFF